jgi:putative RecB family exonuclease
VKQDSLFTRLLDCVSEVEPVVVLREAPSVAPPVTTRAGDGAGAVDASELDGALAAWTRARARIDAVRAVPAPSAAALDVVTWAELFAFRECPLRYRYRYRTRVADVLGTDTEAATVPRQVDGGVSIPKGMTPAKYGVLVHAALERVVRDGTPVDEAIDAAAATLPGGSVTQKAKGAAVALVKGVLASDIGASKDSLAVETPFEVRLDSLVVHGVFDRIERTPGGTWRVIDYKVGVEDPSHEFQVQAYMWALKRIYGEATEGVVCYLRNDGAHLKPVATSSAPIDMLAASLERALRTGDYPATPGDVCATCAYRSACPSSAV